MNLELISKEKLSKNWYVLNKSIKIMNLVISREKTNDNLIAFLREKVKKAEKTKDSLKHEIKYHKLNDISDELATIFDEVESLANGSYYYRSLAILGLFDLEPIFDLKELAGILKQNQYEELNFSYNTFVGIISNGMLQ